MADVQIQVDTQTAKRRNSAEQPLAKKKRSHFGVADDVCSDCSRLDLARAQEIVRNEAWDWDFGVLVRPVGKQYREPFETNCTLCRILLASRQASLTKHPIKDENLDSGDELRAHIFWRAWPLFQDTGTRAKKAFNGNETICLNVVSSGSALQNFSEGLEQGCPIIESDGWQPTGATVQRIPQNFDATVARDWVRYCTKYHKTTCSSANVSSVRVLNLIDCETRSVGPSSDNPPYVALSYVWASHTASDEPNSDTAPGGSCSLPSHVPRVILDAIAVTRALGFRYLWVDKFCIDQNNPQQKHEQIRNMDAIYAGSEITIIAAAGNDETHGLPGVGETARSSQPTVRIGDCTVVSTMRDTHESILSSRWSTRGWTFQEAMLSRRRLVFTQEQLYFECDAMNCCESVSMSMDAMHIRDKSRSHRFIRKGLFGMDCNRPNTRFGTTELPPIQVFIGYLSSVENYTSRQLRYHEDSLNAFQGIIRKFEKHPNPVFQIWGIPFISKRSGLNLQDLFADALCWTHEHSCWDGRALPSRRPEFPSWSWAGWAGAAKYHERTKDRKAWCQRQMRPISLEFESGRTVPLGMLEKEFFEGAALRTFPPYLRLDAKVIPPRLISYNEKDGWKCCRRPATAFLSEGAESPLQLLEKLNRDSWLHCVLVANYARTMYCFILATQDGLSSRVGVITVDMWYWLLEKDKALEGEEAEWKTFHIR